MLLASRLGSLVQARSSVPSRVGPSGKSTVYMKAIHDKSTIYEEKACYEYCVTGDEASASKVALG
jgi:hypothetical protein